jgi:hypothetical protein
VVVAVSPCQLMAPLLTSLADNSRRLYWELPDQSLALAFVAYAVEEIPELVVSAYPFGDEWVVTTTYTPEQLLPTFFVIHLVARLHSRQLVLERAYEAVCDAS